ncbi:MAG: acyltransferase [Methanobacteriota archaeon]
MAEPPFIAGPPHEHLRRLREELARHAQERWRRDLPFEELLFDRWERARALGFGEESSIYQSSVVLGDVKVGRRTWIGPWTLLDGSGGLTVGDTCAISAGVHIYTHDTVAWALSGGKAAYERAPVRIGDACYVGPHSLITRGVTIGDHVLVGANSFVKSDVPPNSIAAGSPARILGKVEVRPDGAVQLLYDPPRERP